MADTNNEQPVMKLNLDVEEANIKRFNTDEALHDMVDETKYKIIKHKAHKKILIGAKDSGKTHLVKVDEIWKMERDPMASGIAARKYSTAAAKRLGASMAKTLIRIQQKGYKFPKGYKKSQNYFYRLKSKSNMMENQLQEYVSFDDENGLAGVDVQNGGYFATVHIEEPALKDDLHEAPTEHEWHSALGVMEDSVNRTVRDYNATNPHFPPFETTWWITMNDWDEGHPESIYAQKYAPREEFLRRNLGGMDPEMLLGNRDLVLKNWDKIAQALIDNHTWMVYVEKDDTLIVRMTKLANPQLREDPDFQRDTLANIQKALISNNNFELARQLGMLYEGSADEPFCYNIDNIENVKADTKAVLEKDVILGRSIAWDVDVNRRLTGTCTLITGHAWTDNNPHNDNIYIEKVRFTTLPQIAIPAYGRGEKGENTDSYYYGMAEATTDFIERYPIKYDQFGSHLTMDDDRGPWLNGVSQYLDTMLDEQQKMALNLHFQIKTGKEGNIIVRQDNVQSLWDEECVNVDFTNTDLFKFITEVRKDAKGKRIEKAKFEKLADFVNSYEGSLFPWKQNKVIDSVITERIKEEESYMSYNLGNEEVAYAQQ